ncbi:hypothetical protein BC832DRAFT_559834 [Gaertneriomyces semiglobifer]|nr:hypothetical protein BC832DRAFT_559834 [Gaertneriomyces semiglobifer]
MTSSRPNGRPSREASYDETQPLLPPPVTASSTHNVTAGSVVSGATASATKPDGPGASGKKADVPTRMPKRTTKTSQKLTLFPADVPSDAIPDEDTQEVDASDDTYTIPQLPHVIVKTQKERWLSRLEKKWLPRVTAYCTANSYKMRDLVDFLKSKSGVHRCVPKKFDEVVHTPFAFTPGFQTPQSSNEQIVSDPAGDTIPGEFQHHQVHERPPNIENLSSFFEQNIDALGRSLPSDIPYTSLAKRISPIGECLFFEYGVVVMWGLSEEEEQRILALLEPFEEEKLPPADVEVEEFHFHYNAYQQPRIYNDVITLKNPANYMIKVAISHAIAQSVKLALFEELIEETIEGMKHVPTVLAETGNIRMSRKSVNRKIGQLFIMRINVNLVSNVLDIPEIFWSEPALEPLYMAIRGYLEISQRVDLLNQRVSVISDLLDMLKEHQTSSHGEQLEWIVIILIALEIVIAVLTISFDLSSYLWRFRKRI